jgi:hypothetical protein
VIVYIVWGFFECNSAHKRQQVFNPKQIKRIPAFSADMESQSEMAKKKLEKVDGLGPADEKRLRTAIRQVWSWNHARRLCIARATDKKGFGHCEKCKAKVPKLFADHIKPVGTFDARTFIEKMFLPSKKLQALCKRCHDSKTREERNFEKYGF